MKLKPLLFFFLLIFMVNVASAEEFADKWYQVEIIVFSHLSEQAVNSEQWPSVNPPDFSDSKNFLSNQYRLLPKNHMSLTKEELAIQKTPGYQVLLHLAWQQKVQTPEQAKPIHLYSDSQFPLDGTITIGVRKYFDVHVNLYLGIPVSQLAHFSQTDYFSHLSSPMAYFHLLQTRRMRSEELNYIDHPLYGVLIKITRMENPVTQKGLTSAQTRL